MRTSPSSVSETLALTHFLPMFRLVDHAGLVAYRNGWFSISSRKALANNKNPFESGTECSSALLCSPTRRLVLWTMPDSNRLPHPCHGCALPGELMAQILNVS